MQRVITMLILTVVLLGPSANVVQAANPKGIPADAVEAKVSGHVDGEKIKVKIGGEEEEVRFIGVDAPEPKNEDDLPECYAEESTKRLKTMLPVGRTVYLERDVEDRDRRDRLWRYVWFPGKDDGKPRLANEIILREGFAIAQDEEKNTKHEDRLAKAEKAAKDKDAGLWGACGGGHVAITPVPRHGSGEDPGTVGETLVAEGMAVTLNSTFYTYEYNFSTPKGGYIFLIAEVRIENVDDEDHGYDSMRFSAKDLDSGAEYDDTFALLDQPLESSELSPGEYVIGQIALEIQETATNVRLKYDVSFLGEENIYWLVPSPA